MKERINSSELKDFLVDFEKNSETHILEEGKEKDDIIEIAKTKGINLRNNKDLAGFKTVFTFAEKANKNGARLPKKQLLRSLPSLIGKPVDIDHIRNMVVGHYIDYRFRTNDSAVIAYGVFYKSNFGKEWEQAKKLFKSNKLGTSFEIWCPKNKRKNLDDGTYELCEMEIAGGGLMFKQDPAFEDAMVLELAKKNIKSMEKELVFASENKYRKEEIITADYWKDSIKENLNKLHQEKESQIKQVEAEQKALHSVKCSNCTHQFERGIEGEIKCPNCFSILKSDGSVDFPPQVVDFKVHCPNCREKQWRIVDTKEDNANVKCMNCTKEYNLKFSKPESDDILDKIRFVYNTSVTCPQCSSSVGISTTSDIKNHEAKCEKCGLGFNVDIEKVDRFKQVEKISEVEPTPKKTESSEEGGENEMTDKNKEEQKVEAEAEETKAEVTTKDEVKVEDTPKAEEKKEETKAEEVKEETTSDEKEAVVKSSTDDKAETEEETPDVSEDSTENSKESETSEVSQDSVSETEKDAQEDTPQEKQEQVEKSSTDNRLRKLLDRAVAKIVALKKETKLAKASLETSSQQDIAKIKEDAKAKIELYKASAKTIIERQAELGNYEHSLSDKDILDDDKFAKAKLEKENSELKAKMETSSDVIGIKSKKDDQYFDDKRAEINQKAFGPSKS